MFYFKKIVSYFDFYEYGEKKKSCGYSRILVKDREVTIEIQIKGLETKENCMCDIDMTGKQRKQLGKILLEGGTGCYRACFHSPDLDGSGFFVFDATGFFIPISKDSYCQTSWEWGSLPKEIAAEEFFQKDVSEAPESEASFPGEKPAEEKQEESAGGEKPLLQESVTEEQGLQEERTREESNLPEEDGPDEAFPPEERMTEENGLRKEETMPEEGLELEKIPMHETIHEDKWEQLRALYPVCHPFGENEDYISIAPKDFIVLRKEYQNLVSNSFLLHSFYNYHHLILGKMSDDEIFYIGVPGVYFEREKKVAVMFGFEGFAQSARINDTSAANRKGGTAIASGAFGYYMKKVEI